MNNIKILTLPLANGKEIKLGYTFQSTCNTWVGGMSPEVMDDIENILSYERKVFRIPSDTDSEKCNLNNYNL